MSFFDELLSRRGLKECPEFLWQLKLTQDEYEELKQCLANAITNRDNLENLNRECTLYYAEYWQKVYSGSHHSTDYVVKSLGVPSCIKELAERFLKYAIEGAKRLHLKARNGWGEIGTRDSLLYQGGLQMNFLMNQTDRNTKWSEFLKKLILRNIDANTLEETFALGVNANIPCMFQYLDTLQLGLERHEINEMPFHSSFRSWYESLEQNYATAKRRAAIERPLKISWDFNVNIIENTFGVRYVVEGAKSLAGATNFLDNYGLRPVDSFIVSVQENGKSISSLIYNNCWCDCNKISKNYPSNGMLVSLELSKDNQRNEISKIALDFLSGPHFLFLNEKQNKYELGTPKQLGQKKVLILVPRGMKILTLKNSLFRMSWNGLDFTALIVPADFTDSIEINENGTRRSYNAQSEIYETVYTGTLGHELKIDEFRETVFLNQCTKNDFKCVSGGNVKHPTSVEFFDTSRNQWIECGSMFCNVPKGKVKLRALCRDIIANQISLINLGSQRDVGIEVEQSTATDCILKLSWEHGRVCVANGEGKLVGNTDDNQWNIHVNDCAVKTRIHLQFTPSPSKGFAQDFVVSFKAPFRDFFITDNYSCQNLDLTKHNLIPFGELNAYSYHIKGFDNFDIKVKPRGNVSWTDADCFKVSYKNDCYVVRSEKSGCEIQKISEEGSLSELFINTTYIQKLMDKCDGEKIVEVRVLLPCRIRQFSIQKNPLIIKENESGDGLTVGLSNNKKEKGYVCSPYMGDLTLIDLDRPAEPSILLPYGNGEEFKITQEIAPDARKIVVGNVPGKVKARLIDFNLRKISYEDTVDFIRNEENREKIAEILSCEDTDSLDLQSLAVFCLKKILAKKSESHLEDVENFLTLMAGDESFKYLWSKTCAEISDVIGKRDDVAINKLLLDKDNKISSEIWKKALAWFDLIDKYDITYNDIFLLKKIARQEDYLVKLLFFIYITKNCDFGTEEFKEIYRQLDCMASQLDFLWIWLMRTVKMGRVHSIVECFVDLNNAECKAIIQNRQYQDIFKSKANDPNGINEAFLNANQNLDAWFRDTIEKFTDWMKCVIQQSVEESITKPNLMNRDFVRYALRHEGVSQESIIRMLIHDGINPCETLYNTQNYGIDNASDWLDSVNSVDRFLWRFTEPSLFNNDSAEKKQIIKAYNDYPLFFIIFLINKRAIQLYRDQFN